MMEYNTQLPHLEIPEYGRNIQVMIDHCITIEDRDERNKCARAIIQIMGQLNPHLRDIADFTHKLWDHLFLISKFKLDVDSPYPRPSAETFTTKPLVVPYPASKIKYKHYGKTIERIIDVAKTCGIAYQIEVESGNTGTDAWDIQVAGLGVPTLLISIPIKYMHTTVEVVNMEDIKNTGKLIAKFIEKIDKEELEGVLCF